MEKAERKDSVTELKQLRVMLSDDDYDWLDSQAVRLKTRDRSATVRALFAEMQRRQTSAQAILAKRETK